jgi:hypothetical protein
MSYDKKNEFMRKKYGLLPPKIVESNKQSLGHGMCGCGDSPYNNYKIQNTIFASLLTLTMIDQATGWFEIVKSTSKSEISIQDLFHITWLARYQ